MAKLAAAGTAASLLVHILTFFGVAAHEHFPLAWGLHLGAIAVFIAAIWRLNRYGWESMRAAPVWIIPVALGLFAYMFSNFFGSVGDLPDGPVETYVNEVLFIHGFSGHWIFFYAISTFILLYSSDDPFPLERPATAVFVKTGDVYEHTQWSVMGILSILAAGLFLLLILVSRSLADDGLFFSIFAGAIIAVNIIFLSLTTKVSDGRLKWSFGSGIIRKSVPLSEVESVTPATISRWNGYGIHRTYRGWLYSLGGQDALLVKLKSGKQFLIGTDDIAGLTAALTS